MSFCLSARTCALAALSAVAFVGLTGAASANDDAAHAIAGKFSQADEADEAAKRAKVLELMAEAKRKADAARAEAQGTTETATEDAPAAEVVDPEGRIAKAQDEARKRAARERADRAGDVSVANKNEPVKANSKPERSREEAEAAAARRLLIEAEMRAKEKAAREEKERLAQERKTKQRLAKEREAKELAEKERTAEKVEKAETTEPAAKPAIIETDGEAASEPAVVEKADKAPVEMPVETPAATAEAEQDSAAPVEPAIAETKPADMPTRSDSIASEPLAGPEVDTAETDIGNDTDTAEQREAETRALAERLRRAREARKSLGTEPNALRGPEPPANGRIAVDPEVVGLPRPDQNVTILIKLEVGKKGVRRWSKTADPMLCLHEFCFLSRGAKKSSEKLTRRIAFGPGVALGKRGLACRSSPSCVFRNIDLGAVEARLQPVDLRFLRHDRRNPALVRPDHSCGLYDGTFSCARTVDGGNWKAWIVPEATAEAVGPEALEAALKAGLKSTTPAHLREVSER